MPNSPGAGENAPPSDRAILDRDPRWAAVQRVVSGATFAKSARLSAFLLYVCERAILGRVDEVTEQHVGIHVFERHPDYNASEDNIVRAHARLLRRKLEEYYNSEGSGEAVRILIPKGAYLPLFEAVQPAYAAAGRTRVPWRGAGAGVLVLTPRGQGIYIWRRPPRPARLVSQFWGQMFASGQPTVIVPCDTALVLHEGYTDRIITLGEYMSRDFWRQFPPPKGIDSGWVANLRHSPFTNNVDLMFCWRLARKQGVEFGRAVVRPARDLRMADLKGANAILIGARRANPWVALFDKENGFQGLFNEQYRDYILNRAPRAGELPIYRSGAVNGADRSYALLEYNRGLASTEHAVILSGLDGVGTEGATDFLLNDASLGHFLDQITPANGDIPHFEVLLAIEVISGSSPRTEIVAYRVRKD